MSDRMFEILYEDEAVIVCTKPAGLPVQTREAARPDMVSRLKNSLGDGSGREPYVGVVHRLDQPVEGVLVFAKTREAAACLSSQVSGGAMKKLYYAVTLGAPAKESGTLRDYLMRDGRTNMSSVVKAGTPGAKEAALSYRTLETARGCALLEVELLTGRHHQIRVQLSRAGAPILGDKKYGRRDGYDGGLALCAHKLTFRHPLTKQEMTFESRPEAQAFSWFSMFRESGPSPC